MRSWWGWSSSKEEKKKTTKESFIDTINRKFKIGSLEKSSGKSRSSQRCRSDNISEKGSRSRVHSRSPSPSTSIPVSRCQSFVDRPVRPCAQPLPLPVVHLSNIQHGEPESNVSAKSATEYAFKPLLTLPLPEPRLELHGQDAMDIDRDLPTATASCDSSSDIDDPTDSHLLSPQASDYENGGRTSINSPSSAKQKVQTSISFNTNPIETSKSANILSNNQAVSPPSRRRPLRSQVLDLQIPHHGAFYSAPDSSMSSPSRSPMRVFGHDVKNSGFWPGKQYGDITFLGSGQCSSPGSGQNSGHNSVGGDIGQVFWPHSRCSPECSPVPSPRMASPGPSSRIHSGAVTPLHPRAGEASGESSTTWIDDGKQPSHLLPLPPPPITVSSPSHFSPSYSSGASPVIPRSPGRTENPPSPGSRWKKGRLLGRGTFGHVYLGFNSESGEMCAMKEVTLFSDDAKSRESAQQLGQEIAVLSRLRHPNIVRYYGSEMVDDKLYIYLEYVSGGSIYKILQEYGHLGEVAIRSYTQQILSGLAYLHGKSTVHRDIKGANILVDPNGRVKLADFGMAKHITGQSCPLSFKGSPYWMAPEVIKNANGCNRAVDIWSLGCTVLEMATTKPPWSQYEGVAAMFKIGNSKELPAIPDHLSDEGKHFVRQCLQRNPHNRPTAAQLLDHPFVRNVAPIERPILSPGAGESVSPVLQPGIGHSRSPPCLETEGAAGLQSRNLKSVAGISDPLMQRNISCPVSPVGSPLLHSRSPQHMSAILSPSPISSPRATSGTSTPLTSGSGAIPMFTPKSPTNPRSQSGFYPNGNACQDLKPDIFRGIPQTHLFGETLAASENGLRGDHFGHPAQGGPYDGQSLLADRVAQQLLRGHVKLSPLLDPNSCSPVLGHNNGVKLDMHAIFFNG